MFAKTLHSRCAVLGAAMSFLFFVACGSDETPAPADKPAAKPAATPSEKVPAPAIPSNVKVDERDADGNPIRFSGVDGQGQEFQAMIGDDAAVPKSFPSDAPLFPGATPMAAMAAGSEGTMVTFKTTESQQTIYDFYQEQLKEQGWEIGDEESFGGQLAIVAHKDKRKLTVSISGTKGDSRISVFATSK